MESSTEGSEVGVGAAKASEAEADLWLVVAGVLSREFANEPEVGVLGCEAVDLETAEVEQRWY